MGSGAPRGGGGDNGGGLTFFAPAERAAPAQLQADVARLCDHPVADAVLQAFGGVVMILNEQRQILAVNATLLGTLGVDDPEGLLGTRPGEALGCLQAEQAPGGCGTGVACRSCGAVLSILAALAGDKTVARECLLTSRLDGGEQAFEFRARATPLPIEGHTFVVLTLHDIGGEKRRQALQRVFFHDVSNLVTALQGACEALPDADPLELEGITAGIRQMTERIAEQVTAQVDLQRIEADEYKPRREDTSAEALLEWVRGDLGDHELLQERTLELPREGLALPVRTDARLARRALGCLVLNALEATAPGGVVRCWSEASDRWISLNVWNDAAIAPEVAVRIFQRSFSTKGAGRGLGTYGAKLIAQRCLDGQLNFTTSSEGTIFSLKLPRT